jgi:predicted DNA-binding protein (UPF0251 family)
MSGLSAEWAMRIRRRWQQRFTRYDEARQMNAIHPQYVTDQDGQRVSVLLPLDEFEALLEDIEDLRDALEARDEPSESWESVKGELGLT